MKLLLTDGTELTPIMVTGEGKYIHGAMRDTLTFVFPDTSLDKLESIFTESNCESINIVGDDASEAIYTGYTIRTELIKKAVITKPETTDTAETTENRVFVTMAQRTYMETQLKSLTETVDILIMENLAAQ